jgi:predicted enzyme related to lactoylglutathione lyase
MGGVSCFIKTRIGLLAAAIGVALVSCAGLEEGGGTVPVLSEEPLTGKFIWHDLVTDDVAGARAFYTRVFGWTYEDARRPGGDDPYTLVRAGDRYVAGMVHRSDAGDGSNLSRWLGYLSVPDVDRAAATTGEAGGTILVAPTELGTAGRVAAIQDPQGAVIGLAHSRFGDPADVDAAPGVVVWNELLTSDREAAAAFYTAIAGLEPVEVRRRGGRYLLLTDGERDRAGILENPLPGTPPVWLTAFAVPDPVEAADRVKAAGGRVLLAPSEELREGTLALVQDPTGALLVLQQWPI